ncbi:MBL fold metallo-hydrolase [Agrobacterium sp. Ap1]|uniref:MBL fold metallo-hydrolase n=1 Tax=Agrobacterium sp. Ap1 TaxID=2815337 RepID=UPI001A8FA9F7|nr:MBL fold metallo-hydrolase [Agrobacterium sp. Ap1]MBO0144519.1 MBL fold metallo-hydrolase [Agrobacterium sp. Ap1]
MRNAVYSTSLDQSSPDQPGSSAKWALSPRRLLRLSAIAGLGLSLLAGQSLAKAPMVGTQAPGYYRLALGKFEVTALSDGTHPFPVHKVLTKRLSGADAAIPLDEASPGEADARLAEEKLAAPVEGSINAFLINTGSKLILIDSGAGSLYGDCCGHLVENLRAAGYAPEQVDEVLLTHLHADHVGGIAPNGKIAFPNATIRVSQTDADYWLSTEREKAAPALLKSMFDGDQQSLAPYIKAGRFKAFSYDQPLEPGIRAIASPGHTPGHSFFAVESEGQKLLLWGDVVHVAPVQFPDPAVTVAYDSDPAEASAERTKIYADAAREGYWIGAAHISFPGLGHVVAKDGHFLWLPANYSAATVKTD